MTLKFETREVDGFQMIFSRQNPSNRRRVMEFKVKIDAAIAALEKNFEDHKKELAEAIPDWTEKLKAAIDRYRDAVDRKALSASFQEIYALHHARPVDNRSEYTKYIGGLKASKEAGVGTLDLDEFLYDQLFNDNWTWRQTSLATNSTYSVSAAAKR